jgi:hypothetical protein
VQLSDNAIGMYDLVNNVFRGNLGTGDFDITNPINDLEIYADGTVETIGVGNYYDSVDGQGTFVSPSSSATTRIYKAFGQLPNGKYKVAIIGNFEFIFQYKNTDSLVPTDYGNIDTWTNSGVYDLDKTGYYYGIAIRYPNNGTIRPSDFNGTISLIPLDNSATCEPLLAVGDYTDVQSILDGVVTRNVGVKVLTGDENFETATATNCYSLTNTLGTGNFADRTIVCSHFDSTSTLPRTGDRQGLAFIVNKGPDYTIAFGATTQFSTQTQWKNWLAAQAAAGTPVIVVYPLATATTESVAGQTLQVTDGDNTLEITQASLTGLELEAEYEQGVEASVEEIEP